MKNCKLYESAVLQDNTKIRHFIKIGWRIGWVGDDIWQHWKYAHMIMKYGRNCKMAKVAKSLSPLVWAPTRLEKPLRQRWQQLPHPEAQFLTKNGQACKLAVSMGMECLSSWIGECGPNVAGCWVVAEGQKSYSICWVKHYVDKTCSKICRICTYE